MIDSIKIGNRETANDMLPFRDSIIPLAKISKLAFWKWDIESNTVWFNNQFSVLLGYGEDELLETNADFYKKIIYEKDISLRSKLIKDLLIGNSANYVSEVRAVCKDGSLIWLQESCAVTEKNPDGSAAVLVAVINDITNVKRAQEHQQEKNKHWESLANMTGLASWVWDVEKDYVTFNKEFVTLLGYSLEEANGPLASLEKMLPAGGIEQLSDGLMSYLNSGGQGVFEMEMLVLCKDRRPLWLHNIGSVAQWDINGRPTVIQGGILDIDKRVKAEEKMKEAIKEKESYNVRLQSEIEKAVSRFETARLTSQAMFESNPYVNLLFNDKYELIDCNPVAISFFGYERKSQLIENFSQLSVACNPKLHAPEMPVIYLEQQLKLAEDSGVVSADITITLKSQQLILHMILKRIPYDESFAITMYLVDMTDIYNITNKLESQGRLLMAVNNAAECLMVDIVDINGKSKSTMDNVVKALDILGRSVNANRSYIWSNQLIDGNLYFKRMVQWFKDDPDFIQEENPPLLDYDTYFPDWRKRFKGSFYMKSEENSKALSIFRGMRREKTMLIIPIVLEGLFWGFAGFDYNSEHIILSNDETRILLSGSFLIASTLVKYEMTENLIEAREKALATTKSKSEFLARMSHEIRTPMNAIIGMTAIANKAQDMERVKYCLNKIDTASRQLLSIINDVLDMSKIDADKFEIISEEFNFERMMENVFNVIQVRIEEKHQEFFFNLSEPFTRKVVSDELRLNQVLVNLLSNAIKFTSDYGTITLSVKTFPIDNYSARLRVSVTDTGIGIDESQIKQLFDSFEQADGGITRKYGGTGLGLAICKKIINLMDGVIWVESTLGEGSSFIFEINIKWGEELPKNNVKVLRDDLRILVVDDLPEVLEYLKNILEGFNLRCNTAESGYVAIDMVQEAMTQNKPFDLILLDWKMPGIDGLETARYIRELTHDQVIVIIISAFDWADIELEARELKLKHYLPKPVLPSMLYNKLIEVIGANEEIYTSAHENDDYSWEDKHLLLAEDIEINREIVISLLSDTGIIIDIACDGEECVKLFSENPEKYDLILMDVQMPGLDGLGATHKIRALNHHMAKTIPIIAMTANAFKEDAENCIAAGMNDHISKPIDVNTFLPTLNKYLGLS